MSGSIGSGSVRAAPLSEDELAVDDGELGVAEDLVAHVRGGGARGPASSYGLATLITVPPFVQ
jgi:hypothetical protein